MKLDLKKSRAVYNHLHELTNSPTKIKAFVEDIFYTLHTSANELSMIEFKEFCDLAAKGLKSESLDIDTVMNEFKLADRTEKGKVSKEDFTIYVNKLYKYISEIIYSEISLCNDLEKRKVSKDIEFPINQHDSPLTLSNFYQPSQDLSSNPMNLQRSSSSYSIHYDLNSETKNNYNSGLLPAHYNFVSLNYPFK